MQHPVAADLQEPEHRLGLDWVTAKVTQSEKAHRIVNRLDVLGYDYNVVQQDRDLRILVRRQMLEEVLGWIDDLSNRQATSASPTASRLGIHLLLAIPTGLLFGAVMARLLGIQSPASYAIAGYAGLAALTLTVVTSSRFSKPR